MMTATQLAVHWNVHPTTVSRAIEKAKLPKARGLAYDDQQVAQIRACLPSLQRKTHAKTPQTQRAVSSPIQQPAHLEDPLHQRVAQLEAQVAAQQRRIEQLDGQLQKTIAWGRNTARIIRTLWHRMPDYQQGETPGEFPAVTTELLDEGGQELVARMEEEDQRTDTFFAELDQQRKTSRDEGQSEP